MVAPIGVYTTTVSVPMHIYAAKPKNGYVAGILASLFFDKMPGLTDH
ncbi:hypothetical protein [Paraburkholderia phenoliruptrix]|nr:hypothetical protein [Paraburkholderia phenoliruptrix]